jgi:hypothetical protein
MKAPRCSTVPGLALTPKNSRLPSEFYLQRGLFTRRRIPYLTTIGEFYGERLTVDQAARRNSNYQFEIKDANFVLDAKNLNDGSFVRFVKAAKDISSQNCQFVQRGKRIFLVARCDIPANSELFAWYGYKV